jgi:aminoglycoside phosphotransferase (APT) family kinase protein
MRTLSKPIAQGRTAEIYLWDDRHVLKLFRDWCPPQWVDDEARIAKAICDAGVPAPAPGELLEIDGRRGLLYERIEGISMLEDMNARPWLIFKYARSLADLHIQINKQTITGLRSYKNRLRWDISHSKHLETELQNRLLQKLDALPDGNNLCHGDYHPGNVLLSEHGPVVIDWVTASAGSPWLDVARTSMILSIGAKSAKNQVRPIIRMVIKLYHRAYVSHYRAQVRDSENELNSWRPLIAAARLNEEIAPERETLLDMAKV